MLNKFFHVRQTYKFPGGKRQEIVRSSFHGFLVISKAQSGRTTPNFNAGYNFSAWAKERRAAIPPLSVKNNITSKTP
jgi:hypothetical protein